MLRPLGLALFAIFLTGSPAPKAWGWENHVEITQLALQAYEGWEELTFEPISQVLPALKIGDKQPTDLKSFTELLGIHQGGVNWDWQPSSQGKPNSAINVLSFSAIEPDHGMDQNLNVSEDQKYMGGTTGLSSQGFRHMYYRPFSILEPLVTFHIPMREMGQAPARASLYFKLANQAREGGHSFWAYRFLGWGLHYVQDIGQPYHASQFASFRLLPIKILMTVGWEAFMHETKRIVGNFHLTFEEYTVYLLDPSRDARLSNSFKVPNADPELKTVFENRTDLPISEGVRFLAEVGSRLAPEIASTQISLMGKILREPTLDIGAGFRDAKGQPKVDFRAIEADAELKPKRKELYRLMDKALSNTGVATRWYIDQFRAASTTIR